MYGDGLNVSARFGLYRAVDDVERALEELYRRRYVKFEGVLSAITGDREVGRDAVQEAFAIALARKGQFRGDGDLEGWVWKIALRVAARSRKGAATARSDLQRELPEGGLDGELAGALRMLSPRRRLFVFLRYFADFTYEEIAAVCGVSRGTVAATLAQARSELRPAVEGISATGGLKA